jgi:hypothetical protein
VVSAERRRRGHAGVCCASCMETGAATPVCDVCVTNSDLLMKYMREFTGNSESDIQAHTSQVAFARFVTKIIR